MARCKFRDRTLLHAPGQTVTYGEFAAMVEGAAVGLAEQGMRPGDRLAVAARNGLDAAVAIWACARGGFIYVGLPTNLRAQQWAYMLAHSAPAMAWGQPDMMPALTEAGTRAGMPAGRVGELGDRLTARLLPWRDEVPMPDPETTYAVVYTSGTTGHPKAAQVCHRMAMHVAAFYVRALRLRPSDKTAIHLPFYYVSGHLTQLNPVMAAGGSAVAMPEFSATELVRLIRDEAVTFIDVVPSIFSLLLREPGFANPGCAGLRVAAFGGAPMPVATLDAVRTRLPGVQLCEVYGMSETAGVICAVDDKRAAGGDTSVGRPVRGVEVRIVDDCGVRVAAGDPGELWVRGPVVTPGYLHDDTATAEAITDGWLHTGDYANLGGDGTVTVLDRKKDMIIRGGAKVYPAEVENVLTGHPAIAEAAVFGLPDRIAGEQVAAYVVAADGANIDASDLRHWVRTNFAARAVPRHVRVVDRLPQVPTGKVDKKELRARLASELAGARKRARAKGDAGA